MSTPEFSRPVVVEKLPPAGQDFAIEAEAAERDALARRFGLLGIDRLAADIRLRPVGAAGAVRASGRIEAVVRQACVVTLVELTNRVEAEFEVAYAPAHAAPDADRAEITIALDEEDPPDPLIDGVIDIGETTAEQLALALDPYPRAPGAVFDAPPADGPAARAGGLSALAGWKPRDGSN